MANKIPVEVSGRHVHLSRKDADTLFGKGYTFKKSKELSQPGQFAAEETVSIINGDRKIENVRILGPEREQTQVELSLTDVKNLRIKEMDSSKIKISGPNGSVGIRITLAHRHLHASPEDAKKLRLKNNQLISIKIPGKRGVIFSNVLVRISKDYKLAFHIDTDEGNAAGIEGNIYGEIIRQS